MYPCSQVLGDFYGTIFRAGVEHDNFKFLRTLLFFPAVEVVTEFGSCIADGDTNGNHWQLLLIAIFLGFCKLVHKLAAMTWLVRSGGDASLWHVKELGTFTRGGMVSVPMDVVVAVDAEGD